MSEYGFIRDMLDVKVLILYVAARASYPMTMQEVYELLDGLDRADRDTTIEELGDVLFSAVCVAEKAGIDPEMALHRACEKFIGRFSAMEQGAHRSGCGI